MSQTDKREAHNAEIRQRTDCIWCGDRADDDHECKYAAAGGILEGPFCSSDCYWAWMNADSTTHRTDSAGGSDE